MYLFCFFGNELAGKVLGIDARTGVRAESVNVLLPARALSLLRPPSVSVPFTCELSPCAFPQQGPSGCWVWLCRSAGRAGGLGI